MATQVNFRPLTAVDGDLLIGWRNDPDVRRWMYTDHVITREEHQAWLDGALQDPRRRYWIVEADNVPAGLANLYDIAPEHSKASWGYYLAEQGARGRGLGAMVEFWIIEEAFGPMGLSKLCCEVLAENEAVLKLHDSFGFTREALFRQHVRKGGEPADVVGFGLLSSEWPALRSGSLRRLRDKGFDL